MRIEKIEEYYKISSQAVVKVTEAGNVTELLYLSKKNSEQPIRLLGDKKYVDLRTGEVKNFIEHEDKRTEHKNSLYRTFATLRGIINSNINNPSRVRHIILTYAECMTDNKRLYNDFKNFNMKFQYKYKKAEYIAVAEPQRRGAWHLHILYIFPDLAPFLPNDELAKMWGHGFTKIKALDKSVDNIGLYFCAYMTDIEIEYVNIKTVASDRVKTVEVTDEETGKKVNKRYLKGGRLSLYPSGMNIFRTSRGIARPTEYTSTYGTAIEKLNGATPTYTNTIKITDEAGAYSPIIIKREYYNTKRINNSQSQDNV